LKNGARKVAPKVCLQTQRLLQSDTVRARYSARMDAPLPQMYRFVRPRTRVDLNETFLGDGQDETEQKFASVGWDAHLMASKFSKICSGGGGTAASPNCRKFVAIS
jgi:hypothetical protein